MRQSEPHQLAARRLPFIDVLRGLAILLVLLCHLPPDWAAHLTPVLAKVASMGGRGVDLFFVLSGFLIATTALRRATAGCSTAAQAGAYAVLRIARIWPLYGLLLGLYASNFYRVPVAEFLHQHARYYIAFFANQLASPHLELGVLWSLAVEEQFYLIVGFLIWLTARNRAFLAHAFVGLALAAICASVGTRFQLQLFSRYGMMPAKDFEFQFFFSTLSRIDQIAIGLLTAVGTNRFNRSRWAGAAIAPRLSAWIAIMLLTLCLLWLPSGNTLGFSIVGFFCAAAALWVQQPGLRDIALGKIENFFARVGQLSFGLYLLHPILRHYCLELAAWLNVAPTKHSVLGLLAVWLAASYAAASLSYQFLEAPVLRRAYQWTRHLLDSPLPSRVDGQSMAMVPTKFAGAGR